MSDMILKVWEVNVLIRDRVTLLAPTKRQAREAARKLIETEYKPKGKCPPIVEARDVTAEDPECLGVYV